MHVHRTRNIIANEETNQLEAEWWDKNAQVIEAIWTLPESIRLAVREHYLKKAKSFFLCGSKKTETLKVIEIGCGSGWVGRMIAEPNIINIVGLDLSEQQIQMANQEAIKADLSEICQYYCQNLADFVVSENPNYNSVLIHAILHHLSWQEIHSIFKQITVLGSGTKIFIYEPVYLSKYYRNNSLIWRILRKTVKVLFGFPYSLGRFCACRFEKSYNENLTKDLNCIVEEASKNNWVLSPKEIVFEESELLDFLEKYCRIEDRYLCNYNSIRVGQIAAMYDSKELHQQFSQIVLPLTRHIDNFLFASGLFSCINNDYVFMGYECVLK
jgi:SAM-dependent methyltransferase